MFNQSSLARKIAPLLLAPLSDVRTVLLDGRHEPEMLGFLSERPHTVTMVGFVRDNGLLSPLNRGAFDGCRNRSCNPDGNQFLTQ
jgi:hypothetical protein